MDNTAKLELTIDLSNKEQTAAFANLFLALAGQTQTFVVAEETSKITKKVDSPKKETPKQEPAKTVETPKQEPAKTVETPAAQAAAEEAPEEKKEAQTQIKIEDVRALLQTKVANHRDTIKEKLTSYGANNVTSLKQEYYQEFSDFLKAL